jgi:hypothetical protein
VIAEDPFAYAKRRLREGASDADVRIELVDRNVDRQTIDAAMNLARPQRSVHLPTMLVGLAIVAVGMSYFFLRAMRIVDGDHVTLKAPTAVCAIGAAIFARGLAGH